MTKVVNNVDVHALVMCSTSKFDSWNSQTFTTQTTTKLLNLKKTMQKIKQSTKRRKVIQSELTSTKMYLLQRSEWTAKAMMRKMS